MFKSRLHCPAHHSLFPPWPHAFQLPLVSIWVQPLLVSSALLGCRVPLPAQVQWVQPDPGSQTPDTGPVKMASYETCTTKDLATLPYFLMSANHLLLRMRPSEGRERQACSESLFLSAFLLTSPQDAVLVERECYQEGK